MKSLITLPSIKSILTIKDLDKRESPIDIARRVRDVMESYRNENISAHSAMSRMDRIIGSYGIEYIAEGFNSRSPAIEYCNMGDTYDSTVMFIKGKFVIGCWGSIVERGSYK